MAVTKQKSENVPQHGHDRDRSVERRGVESKDERARRTRSRIDAAFVELLHRRAYGDIRVSDIAKKAGVGRPTFYAHFATKDDLLRSQFKRVVAPMLVAKPNIPERLDGTHFFAHVGSAQYFYKALMGPNGGTAPRVLRDCFEARVRQVLSLDATDKPSLTQSATARSVASTLLAVVECWLEQGARETPQQVQTLFASLVSPGLRSQTRR
jgi:AcrR family transcriptional regulator